MMERVKVYVAARFKGRENQQEIERLCAAVRAAGMKDYCFVRDAEKYEHTFDDPKELWSRSYDELAACDALLIDVSDYPTGGRLVEAGMAFALRKRVIVVVKQNVQYKPLFDGISSTIIEYTDHKDLTAQLKRYDRERTFTTADQALLVALLVFIGLSFGWALAHVFVPLGIVTPVAYWLVFRHFVPLLRAYDRVVVYIPLAGLWLGGFLVLQQASQLAAVGWLVAFWIVTLPLLRKYKFSL